MEQEKKASVSVLWTLFFSMLYISAFTFGGGFVIVTFMKKKFVDELHWLEEAEMLDLTALGQSSPGPIAVNAAILVGWRVAGFAGMLAAVLGTVLPPLGIITLVSAGYQAFAGNPAVALVLRGMQSGVAAVLLDVVLGLGGKILQQKSIVSVLVMAAAFLATWVYGVNVVLIILGAGLVGLVRGMMQQNKEGSE